MICTAIGLSQPSFELGGSALGYKQLNAHEGNIHLPFYIPL